MRNTKDFQSTIQAFISPEESSWTYRIPNLPQPSSSNKEGLIKCISFGSSDVRQEVILRYRIPPTSRITIAEPLDKLLLISFANFCPRWPALSSESPPRPTTGNEKADYITRLLTNGIKLNGIQYHFFGHSNSQLKSRSCFMYAATKEVISSKIEAMGDFKTLKSVGKMAKRIGLLFSGVEVATRLSPDRCEDIQDIKRDDYIFTDGCGLISLQLAQKLAQRRNILFRAVRYLPSVYQIRYRGYKGVLAIDPSLSGQVQVQFRESMRKFKDSSDYSLAVVDYSKPYALGSLNDEVVVLLHTLGISESVLLRKQQHHLDFLRSVSNGEPRESFQFLAYCNRIDLSERLLLDGIEAVQSSLQSLVKQEYAKMLNKRDEQRCRILIPQSRLLFGICDTQSKNGCSGKLKEGECFVRITGDGTGSPRTIVNTEVLVTRNPCLHPGDLQKFKAVDVPGLRHLVDCIVFSTKGKRLGADLMSGGDLDGDKFFVTWDTDIIPRTMAEPAQYPGGKELVTFGKITADLRAEYFARHTNVSLGKIKNLYMKWARLGNAMSPECQQLNRLFSQCVDGNRIRIPENLEEFSKLEDPPEPGSVRTPFHSFSTLFTKLQPISLRKMPIRDKIAMSEYELLQLLLRWCERNSGDIMEYSHLIDFSALSDEQRTWVLGCFPPSAALQMLVTNGLLQSEVISPEELHRFSLDHPHLRWKPVFKSTRDHMRRFLPTVCHSLETFHKKLIVFSTDERLTFAIYVPNKISRASEVQVDSSVRVFAFPHSQGARSPNYKVLPTKKNYRLFCDENVLQLYERRRSNTWIFLRRPYGDDSLYRNEKSQGDKRRKREETLKNGTNVDCKASVALDKISRSIHHHIGQVQQNGVLSSEIYVISNRDVQSMQLLDQWLNYIDTEKLLPLFEKLEVSYKIPKLEGSDWSSYSELVVAIVRHKNLLPTRLLNSIGDLSTILNLLNDHDEKLFLRDIFAHILTLEWGPDSSMDQKVVLSTLLSFLPEAVYLVPTFLQSQLWERHKAELEENLIYLGPILLRHLVASENEFGRSIQYPFKILLQELKRISLQEFAELVEFIALSIRSSEAALDLLLGALGPASLRLLVGHPDPLRQFASSLFGIALDHIDEASNHRNVEEEYLRLSIEGPLDGFTIIRSILRVDSSMSGFLKIGDHVRLTVTDRPLNAPSTEPFSMDALILTAEMGVITCRCLRRPPSYIEQCAWAVTYCGSFVTSKASFDAVTSFYSRRETCCGVYGLILGMPNIDNTKSSPVQPQANGVSSLNESQNAAVASSIEHPLTFIWGPPGTGKTHTIVVILIRLLEFLPYARFLVTAPTHNAVDNLLRRFVGNTDAKRYGAIRVSTQLPKVAPDLLSYTCDAMFGKDLSTSPSLRNKAQKRIKDARLVFTTCIGAALGLLRNEKFDVVIVDEASQQTEPATLVPLVKGCTRAIMVGDHVQLRPTVQKHAILAGHDISLFERVYNMPSKSEVGKVLLNTQYRMHRAICNFSAAEFYNGKIKTDVLDNTRLLPPSLFPWPADKRMVWIECDSTEDLGRQSKANSGQVELCKSVIKLLHASPSTKNPSSISKPSSASVPTSPPSIVILTPYTRQRQALGSAIPGVDISSIDGYQGREADIVVFVTVRCNAHCDLGFLKDMRRLNVVMTRAKTGVIIIGNRNTLARTAQGVEDIDKSKAVWQRLIEGCAVVELPGNVARP